MNEWLLEYDCYEHNTSNNITKTVKVREYFENFNKLVNFYRKKRNENIDTGIIINDNFKVYQVSYSEFEVDVLNNFIR